MRKKLADAEVLRIFALALAGESLRSISRAFPGVHLQHVAAILQGHARAGTAPGHPLRLAWMHRQKQRLAAIRRRKAETAARYPAAARSYERGLSLRAAAEKHGVTFTKLGTWMRARGYATRPRGRPGRG